MRVTIAMDYPDELIERFGEQDAAATLAARLEECYPGSDGDDAPVLILGTGALTADPRCSDVRELAGPQLVIGVGGRTWLASAEGLDEVQGTGELTDGPVVRDGDVEYVPWTDGRAVGWRCRRDGRDEYLLLNPSDRDGDPDDAATVFLYVGTEGSADLDAAVTHVEVHRG